MIASLQSWRFIFALMIFLHHFPVNGKGLFEAGGSCGVSFFLILSGFVMAAGYGDKVLSPSFSFGNYMIKRGARIYPLHLLCFLVALVLAYKNIDGFYLLKLLPNLLLLQSWIPIQGIYFSGNAVSWCLSDLVFFYAAAYYGDLGYAAYREQSGTEREIGCGAELVEWYGVGREGDYHYLAEYGGLRPHGGYACGLWQFAGDGGEFFGDDLTGAVYVFAPVELDPYD